MVTKLTTGDLLFIIFCLTAAFQLFIQFYFHLRLARHKNPISEKLPAVSVIIAAQNEENNLVNFLPIILAQDYPEYQVVVVNDRSWDESLDVLKAFAQKDKKLKIVDNPNNGKDHFAKKFAITLGIKAAKYDKMVFIDADCKPAGKLWLRAMASGFSGKHQIVLGAGIYHRYPGFLNKLIRFETCQTAVQYLSFAKGHFPYMGVGRNLAYTHEIYDAVRGFKRHYHLASGDDDLFVNQAANRNNTAVIFDNDSLTSSEPKKNFISWYHQKKRHLTTGPYYQLKHKALLGLINFSFVLQFCTFVGLCVIHNRWYIALIILICRIIFQILIFIRPFKVMKSLDTLFLLPILEIAVILINFTLLISNQFKKQNGNR